MSELTLTTPFSQSRPAAVNRLVVLPFYLWSSIPLYMSPREKVYLAASPVRWRLGWLYTKFCKCGWSVESHPLVFLHFNNQLKCHQERNDASCSPTSSRSFSRWWPTNGLWLGNLLGIKRQKQEMTLRSFWGPSLSVYLPLDMNASLRPWRGALAMNNYASW